MTTPTVLPTEHQATREERIYEVPDTAQTDPILDAPLAFGNGLPQDD